MKPNLPIGVKILGKDEAEGGMKKFFIQSFILPPPSFILQKGFHSRKTAWRCQQQGRTVSPRTHQSAPHQHPLAQPSEGQMACADPIR